MLVHPSVLADCTEGLSERDTTSPGWRQPTQPNMQLHRAAKRRGRLPDSGSGMSDVVHWLFNDGASSRLGAADAAMPDGMSVISLQVSLAAAPRRPLPRR